MDRSKWIFSEPMEAKVYVDPVQASVRTVIGRALIHTFDLFTYELNPDTNRFVPQLPLPQETLIVEVVDYVRREVEKVVLMWSERQLALERAGDTSANDCMTLLNRFKETFARITPGFVAQHLLNLMSTFKAGKNWNSAGSNVGASLCQLAALLSCLDNASTGNLVDIDFPQTIPQGRVETGSKHGHCYVSYVEFMTAAIEPRLVVGGEELYLDHTRFRRDHHDEKVREIFDEKLVTCAAPAPRPTRAHTFDFNLTYKGARLIDGECKLAAKSEDEGVLVFHTADQFAYKNTALGLLSTNNCFRFFLSRKNIGRGKVFTRVCETKKYKLGSVTDITIDNDDDIEWLQVPPPFLTRERGVATPCLERNDEILEMWGKQRSEVRGFVFALVQALDWLVQAISEMDIKEVGRCRTRAFHAGVKEPGFLATNIPDLKSRRPINQPENFIYCARTMEGEDFAKNNAALHDYLYKVYKRIADSNLQLSDELKRTVDHGLVFHNKDNNKDNNN